jgi:filamentous hemagglutinin
MMGRLRAAYESGRPLFGADANFYLHEAAEATMWTRLGPGAHSAALAKYGISPFAVYHPLVIRAHPALFNDNWRRYWGIQ